jgi:1-acyl-sn-glycerol-3-phosphate acyltransferase
VSLPPRWIRRLVLWPLPVLLVWLYLATVPLLLIVAFVVSYRLPGKWRAVRALGLATVYAFVEVVVILVSFGAWVGTGFGLRMGSTASQDFHYRLLGWALRTLVGAGRRLFVLDVVVQRVDRGEPDDPAALAERPLIVLSRHAGPADSILVAHELVDQFHRRPRIVLKEALQWDPIFDILLNRVPSHFVRPGADRARVLEEIGELAATMSGGDAFVIFPEGGNFTEHRRARSIAYFEERGRWEEADRARRLRYVLPPRPNGALAALAACPEADVVVVAHTGLDQITGLRDLWRTLPDHKVLDMAFAVVPGDEIAPDREARVEMMWRAWERIDEWIGARRPGGDDQR